MPPQAPDEGRKPVALTIAGSDSGGGAGIQADLKTFERFGVFGTSAITLVTAQNTVGVAAVEHLPGAFVRHQIAAVCDDFDVVAIKTGALGTPEIVGIVAEEIRARSPRHVVVDPVAITTSGDSLAGQGTLRAIRDQLLPLATIVTPNLGEAEGLTGRPVETRQDMMEAAAYLHERGARWVLVKGGHLPGDTVADILLGTDVRHIYETPKRTSKHTHGTGCTLASAITAHLALGHGVLEAVKLSRQYVISAIDTAPGLGHGHGPLNHRAR